MRPASTRLIVLLLVLLMVALFAWFFRKATPGVRSATGTNAVSAEEVARFEALEARENELDRTVWAKELLAEECGRVFDSWWDSLNVASNKLQLLASLPIGGLVVGKFNPPEKLAHAIELYSPAGKGATWTAADWVRFLQDSEQAGWQLMNTEFRHVRFET